MTRDNDRDFSRKIARAKLVLFMEDMWFKAYPLMGVAGLFLLTALAGVYGFLSPTMHLVLLALFLIGLGWSLRPVLSLRWPDDERALRHLETRSALPHRPATSYRDSIAVPSAHPSSLVLWAAHKRRLARILASLKTGWPRSWLHRRDPYALRFALVLGLLALFAITGSEWRSLLTQAVSVSYEHGPRSVASLDAWISPPDYTGVPPVFLTGSSAVGEDGSVVVPEKSELVIRLNGAHNPVVRYYSPGGSEKLLLEEVPIESLEGGGVNELRVILERPLVVHVLDGGRDFGSWDLSLVPDHPPHVAIVGSPSVTASDALRFEYEAEDDYGITKLEAEFDLSDSQNGRYGIDAPGLFMFEAPDFDVSIRGNRPRQASGRVFRDLTKHPWAGYTVEMRLVAHDDAGQTGASEVVAFNLPERTFRQPLARALIEQRKRLIFDPDLRPLIARALDALMAYPEGLIESSGVYLGIRMAFHQLLRAQDHDDIVEVMDVLWDVALAIEDGDLSLAERELLSLQKQLQDALAQGAPPETLRELMRELREALNRYMEALAEHAMRNMAEEDLQPIDPDVEMIGPDDLSRMLDMIEDLARSGATDAAQQMLAELEDILRNLRPGMAGQMDPQQAGPMMDALRELSEIMRGQQELMDDTFSTQRESRDRGAGGDSERRMGDLAGRQGALERMLEALRQGLEQFGMQGPGELGQAGRSMRGAEESLRDGRGDWAVEQQGEALDWMRESAQAMAQQLLQGGEGELGRYGRYGGRGNSSRMDPLGRTRPTTGEHYGEERNVVPDEITIQRAHEILRILRSRFNDPSRPRDELDYFERLLRGIY